jgi:hypothetical protein
MENGELLDTAGAVLSTYVNIEKNRGKRKKRNVKMAQSETKKNVFSGSF